MSRNEQDILECYDKENKEFDWEAYQQLCDIADYWECDEQPKRSAMTVMQGVTALYLMMAGYQ